MRLDLWSAIVEQHIAARAAIDARFGRTPDNAGLQLLHEDLARRLGDLGARLREDLSDVDAGDAVQPLALHLDEIVLGRLPDSPDVDWPLLQSALFRIDDGGDAFYRMADAQLGRAVPQTLVCEVLLYCLRDGFTGRARGTPQVVASYERRLAALIPHAEPRLSVGATQPATPAGTSKSQLAAYIATGGVVVSAPFLLHWLFGR